MGRLSWMTAGFPPPFARALTTHGPSGRARHRVADKKMKDLIFVMHVKGDDGVQLLGDEEDATVPRTLRTIVSRNGRWQGYSGDELLALGDGWHELEIP
jgi:hypothetical protein